MRLLTRRGSFGQAEQGESGRPRACVLLVSVCACLASMGCYGLTEHSTETWSPDSSLVGCVRHTTPKAMMVGQDYDVVIAERDRRREVEILRIEDTAEPILKWRGRHMVLIEFDDGAEINEIQSTVHLTDRNGWPISVSVRLRPRIQD